MANELFDELDAQGTVVRAGFGLGMRDRLPDGHKWVPHVTPQPTAAQMQTLCESAAQQTLDTFAHTWGYDNIVSAASYAASTVPRFQAEALALIAWRDAVWTFSAQLLAAVQAGTQSMPATPEAFMATLPTAPARPV